MHTRKQAGAATLVLTMLLLFITSLSMFYLNRGLIFEQKTSANQNRATTALEMAEAGIEWTTGMLNLPNDIDASCAPLGTAVQSFRKKYVQTMFNDPSAPTSDVIPATNVFPGCKVNGTTLTCNCPDVPAAGTTATANLGADELPGFSVSFADVTLPDGSVDTESVQITSTGCTAQEGTCTPGSADDSDASSSISVILKVRPLLRAAPAAAVTCGTNCSLGGSFDVVNTDAGTNGILVNAGGTADEPAEMTTVEGQPPENALVGDDASLAALASSDATCTDAAIFNAYFGTTLAQYENAPTTKTVTCSSPSDCGNKTVDAYNEGWRSFYFDQGVEFNNASFTQLGSAVDPVTIVTAADIRFNGNIEIYGLVFSNNADADATGTGTADIHGALVSCAEFSATGNGLVQYDPKALKNVRRGTGLMVRVPGSWKDF